MNFARVFAAQPSLPAAQLVSVESDLARGLHAFSIVGLPDKAVEEARDRVASAIKNTGLTSPKSTNKKIIISLAPAELKKEGSAFDLAVALSYLVAAEEIFFDPGKRLFAGELATVDHHHDLFDIDLCRFGGDPDHVLVCETFSVFGRLFDRVAVNPFICS